MSKAEAFSALMSQLHEAATEAEARQELAEAESLAALFAIALHANPGMSQYGPDSIAATAFEGADAFIRLRDERRDEAVTAAKRMAAQDDRGSA